MKELVKDTLFLIPARGGSKGIPQKNIKLLAGKPLIHYSIAYARLFTDDAHICLSTDDEKIVDCAKEIGLSVPFIRPSHFASDTASSFDVMKHAIQFFEERSIFYKRLVLLQPTSPFREEMHFIEAIQLFNEETEVVVSVVESANNPYYNLFEENKDAFLTISKGEGKYTRRQDCPPVYAFNGSLYIFDIETLKNSSSFKDLTSIKKYVMEEKYAMDLDTPADWTYCEYLANQKYFHG